MNVNPHLQYLQLHQLQQQGLQSGQSPQVAQIQVPQQLQRQQILNQHMQNQTQPGPQLANPLLAALNGSQANGPQNTVNPVLQLQLQLQQQNQLQQHQLQHAAPQVPIIKEVWAQNLELEFQALRTFINDKTSRIYIAMHQEIPGIVARPVGSFKSSSDYHFQTLRCNSDLLNIIQLSFCVTKIKNNEISTSVIWQFNFLYDLGKEMYNEEHLNMLSQTSQINFQLHMTQGIQHFEFSELMIESGLLLDAHVNWISYHAGYDLGFFVSLLMNSPLPADEADFYWWCSRYFPNFFDLKYIGNQLLNKSSEPSDSKGSNNKPLIEYLAEELHLLPISPAIRQHFTLLYHHHQQMTLSLHAYLAMECFKELLRQSAFDFSIVGRYKGMIWGLGNLSEPNGYAPTKGNALFGRPVWAEGVYIRLGDQVYNSNECTFTGS